MAGVELSRKERALGGFFPEKKRKGRARQKSTVPAMAAAAAKARAGSSMGLFLLRHPAVQKEGGHKRRRQPSDYRQAVPKDELRRQGAEGGEEEGHGPFQLKGLLHGEHDEHGGEGEIQSPYLFRRQAARECSQDGTSHPVGLVQGGHEEEEESVVLLLGILGAYQGEGFVSQGEDKVGSEAWMPGVAGNQGKAVGGMAYVRHQGDENDLRDRSPGGEKSYPDVLGGPCVDEEAHEQGEPGRIPCIHREKPEAEANGHIAKEDGHRGFESFSDSLSRGRSGGWGGIRGGSRHARQDKEPGAEKSTAEPSIGAKPGRLVHFLLLHHTEGMGKNYRAVALCAVGIEKICAAEIERLGFKVADRSPGRIYVAVDEAGLARDLAWLNIGLRTAERVLLELGNFPARDFDAYYEGIQSLSWELCCFKDSSIHIERVRSHDSALAAQTSLQAMGQKAAYARLMQAYSMKTMPATGNAVAARIYMEKDRCSVGVDTSGNPLHKRGYRKRTVLAPLKETIAASLLFLSGWNRKFSLADPFCGSGTIAIEAALFALDFAPGLMRKFAFESMPFGSRKAVEDVRDQFEARIRSDVEVEIFASDIDPEALESAKKNAYDAGVGDWIRWSQGRAQDSRPGERKGYLLANPPYGSRMGDEDQARELYAQLAPMRDAYLEAGWGIGFVTDKEDFGASFGLEPQIIRHFFNGAEEQWFHWFPPRKNEDIL